MDCKITTRHECHVPLLWFITNVCPQMTFKLRVVREILCHTDCIAMVIVSLNKTQMYAFAHTRSVHTWEKLGRCLRVVKILFVYGTLWQSSHIVDSHPWPHSVQGFDWTEYCCCVKKLCNNHCISLASLRCASDVLMEVRFAYKTLHTTGMHCEVEGDTFSWIWSCYSEYIISI